MNIAGQRGKSRTILLVLLLGLLNTITPFSIDMYLPGFPAIAADLHTTTGEVALSVSDYFLGFAVGQILYGPLLDRYGRKNPLYAGLILYIITSIACMGSHTLTIFLIARFMQALTGCVASVAAMAMVRDFFPPARSARILSIMVLVLGASPLLAPTAGGMIITAFGWQYVFLLLAAIAFLLLLVVRFYLPEGHLPDRNISLYPRPIIGTFAGILCNPKFLIFTIAGSLSFSGLFVYVAASPVIFMEGFHLSAKSYGAVFAMLSIGFIGGSQLNHLLTRHFSNAALFRAALVLQVVVAVVYWAGVSGGGFLLRGNMVCLFLILTCAGLMYPNAVALALSPFTSHAGSASALLGFLQIGIGGLISSAAGLLQQKGSLPTAVIISLASSSGLLMLVLGWLWQKGKAGNTIALIS